MLSSRRRQHGSPPDAAPSGCYILSVPVTGPLLLSDNSNSPYIGVLWQLVTFMIGEEIKPGKRSLCLYLCTQRRRRPRHDSVPRLSALNVMVARVGVRLSSLRGREEANKRQIKELLNYHASGKMWLWTPCVAVQRTKRCADLRGDGEAWTSRMCCPRYDSVTETCSEYVSQRWASPFPRMDGDGYLGYWEWRGTKVTYLRE